MFVYMSVLGMVLIVVGLIVFETVSSIDNAVINAEVLRTMQAKARRWFLLWGILIAVFVVRGLLPWLIVWFSLPELGLIGSFTATFSSDPHVIEAIHQSKPMLLMGGGVFLALLFLYWLFLEDKHYGLHPERFFHRHGVWFYAVAMLGLTVLVWFALPLGNAIVLAALVGATAFFITAALKQNAEQGEAKLIGGSTARSDFAKIMYLEVIDLTFSIDGVLGAFAFTMSVPLILIGNGIGAIVVRQLTVRGIDTIAKLKYLKNGAMYSIFVLGGVMIIEGFHVEVPEYVSPIATIVIIAIFLIMSLVALKKEKAPPA